MSKSKNTGNTGKLAPAPITWKSDKGGVGVLELGKPKIQKGKPSERVWEAKFHVVVDSAALAGQLDLFHGDLGKHFNAAIAESEASGFWVKPLEGQYVKATLTAENGDWLEGSIEIRKVKADFNTSRQFQASAVRLTLPVKDSNTLLGMQGLLVQVAVGEVIETDDGTTVQVGDVVGYMFDDTDRFAQVLAVRGSEIDIDNFGDGRTIYEDERTQSMHVQSADATPLDTYLDNYRAACVETGETPSWSALIESAAIVAASGDVPAPTATTIYINAAVCEHAATPLPAEA